MSAFDLLVVASNLIVAFGLAAYCIRRDRGIASSVSLVVESVSQAVESVSRAGAWRQPLNSYPIQHPAQN
jgi:hypothetical protein